MKKDVKVSVAWKESIEDYLAYFSSIELREVKNICDLIIEKREEFFK